MRAPRAVTSSGLPRRPSTSPGVLLPMTTRSARDRSKSAGTSAAALADAVNPRMRKNLPALIALGAAVDVEDPALARVGGCDRAPRRAALREGILRDAAQITLAYQLVERFRILAGVGVVLVERIAHQREVLLQHRLLGALHAADVVGHDDREEECDHRQDDHQLYQGESTRVLLPVHVTTLCKERRSVRYRCCA